MTELGTDQSKKDLFAALQRFRSAKNSAGEAETLFQMGKVHQGAKLYRAAASAYAAARRAHDKPSGGFDPDVAGRLEAELRLASKQFDKALPLFEELYLRAMENKDSDAQWRALRGLAEARSHLNQVELAQEAYETATRLSVHAPAAERATLLSRFAEFEASQGQIASSREHLSQALTVLQADAVSGHANNASSNSPAPTSSSQVAVLLQWAQLELAHGNYAAARLAATLGLSSEDTEHEQALRSIVALAAEWLDRQAATHRLARPAPPQLASALGRIDANTLTVSKSALLEVLRSPELLTQSARLVPTPPENRAVSLDVYGVSPKTIWGLVGLENGDRIRRVNGYDWNDLNGLSAEELGFANAARIVIELTRQGSNQQVVLMVQSEQLATPTSEPSVAATPPR